MKPTDLRSWAAKHRVALIALVSGSSVFWMPSALRYPLSWLALILLLGVAAVVIAREIRS
jgi:hypothetical protein